MSKEQAPQQGTAILQVLNGTAQWKWAITAGSSGEAKPESIDTTGNFVIAFSTAASVPTAKARQQLRSWGFLPRVAQNAPFSTFGARQDVLSNENTSVQESLTAVDLEAVQEQEHTSKQ